MDVNMASLVSQEIALNKANVGQDILMKTLEKGAEAKASQGAESPRPVEPAQGDKQGRIDLYA